MPLALPVPSVTADLCLPNHIKPASASLESKTSRSLAKVRKHWQGLRVPALSGDENKTLATNKARQSTRHGTKFPARRQSETCTAPPCCHPTPARSRSLEPSWYQSLGRRHVRPAMRSSGKTWEMQRRHSRFSFNSPWGPTGTGFWTLGNFGGKTSTKQYVTCWSCQINFLPLPRFSRKSEDAFPREKQFLVPDSEQRGFWKERLSELGDGLKVGISWQGGKDLRVRRARSIGLELWQPLISTADVSFIDLQYGSSSTKLSQTERDCWDSLHRWPEIDPLKNLDEFAALISGLDLVISVANSTVHFAGALGVTCWSLLPHSASWRWSISREDSYWYPSVKLFRQSTPRSWSPVLEQVQHELQALSSEAS